MRHSDQPLWSWVLWSRRERALAGAALASVGDLRLSFWADRESSNRIPACILPPHQRMAARLYATPPLSSHWRPLAPNHLALLSISFSSWQPAALQPTDGGPVDEYGHNANGEIEGDFTFRAVSSGLLGASAVPVLLT